MQESRYEDYDILAITFNTAWSPPEGVIQNCVKSSQMLHFNVSMMNQDVKLRGTIKWHIVNSAEILMTKRLIE